MTLKKLAGATWVHMNLKRRSPVYNSKLNWNLNPSTEESSEDWWFAKGLYRILQIVVFKPASYFSSGSVFCSPRKLHLSTWTCRQKNCRIMRKRERSRSYSTDSRRCRLSSFLSGIQCSEISKLRWMPGSLEKLAQVFKKMSHLPSGTMRNTDVLQLSYS